MEKHASRCLFLIVSNRVLYLMLVLPRMICAFRNQYLLEVNGRYDGSSKFPTNQRYGFFPSVSAGWRVSKEGFWHVSPKALTDLKVRASYGSLGNGNVASYSYLEQFAV